MTALLVVFLATVVGLGIISVIAMAVLGSAEANKNRGRHRASSDGYYFGADGGSSCSDTSGGDGGCGDGGGSGGGDGGCGGD